MGGFPAFSPIISGAPPERCDGQIASSAERKPASFKPLKNEETVPSAPGRFSSGELPGSVELGTVKGICIVSRSLATSTDSTRTQAPHELRFHPDPSLCTDLESAACRSEPAPRACSEEAFPRNPGSRPARGCRAGAGHSTFRNQDPLGATAQASPKPPRLSTAPRHLGLGPQGAGNKKFLPCGSPLGVSPKS